MTTHDEMRSSNGLPASRGGKGKLALLATLLGAQSAPGSGPDKPSWPWLRAEQLKTRVAHGYCSQPRRRSLEFVPALTSAARRRHRPTRGRPSPRLGHRGLGRAATMGRTVCLVDSIGVSDAGSAVMLRREITWPGLHSSPQGRSNCA